jgi:hypothetical protein
MALPLDVAALLVMLQFPTAIKVGHIGIVLVMLLGSINII